MYLQGSNGDEQITKCPKEINKKCPLQNVNLYRHGTDISYIETFHSNAIKVCLFKVILLVKLIN
jgi:hypothetical protein